MDNTQTINIVVENNLQEALTEIQKLKEKLSQIPSPKNIDFSKGEQETGDIWVDGKPIYTKAVQCIVERGVIYVSEDSFSLNEIDRIIKQEASFLDTISRESSKVIHSIDNFMTEEQNDNYVIFTYTKK